MFFSVFFPNLTIEQAHKNHKLFEKYDTSKLAQKNYPPAIQELSKETEQ
jgi:hypothetical protein